MKNPFFLLALIFLSATFTAQPQWTWAAKAGDNGHDAGTHIGWFGSGDIFIAGTYSSKSLKVGTFTLHNANSSGTTSDIFLARVDVNGTVKWAVSMGGTMDENLNGMAVGPAGYIYLCGSFWGTAAFVSYSLTSTNNTEDAFFGRFTITGACAYVAKIGGTGMESANAIAVDSKSSVYVTGSFDSHTLAVGGTTVARTGSGPGERDVFIAKHTIFGQPAWGKGAGGNKYDAGTSICLDSHEDPIVAGYFTSPQIMFDTHALSNNDPSGNGEDVFVAKLDQAGNTVWALREGGFNKEGTLTRVVADTTGNFCLITETESPTLTIGTNNFTNAGGGPDILVARYDNAGSLQWAKKFGGNGADIVKGAVMTANSQLLIAGNFMSNSLQFGSTTLASNSAPKMFITQFDHTGNVMYARADGSTGYDIINGICTDDAGNVFATGAFQSNSITLGSTNLLNTTNTGLLADVFYGQISNGVVGLEEKSTDKELTVYPVPFTNQLHIMLENQTEEITVALINTCGQTVVSEKVTGSHFVIERNALSSGIYLLSVKMKNNKTVTRRVFIADE